jgi:hypothetical protein
MDMGKTSTSPKIAKAFDVPSRRDFLCPIVTAMASAVLLPQPKAFSQRVTVISVEWEGPWRCVWVSGRPVSDLEDMRLVFSNNKNPDPSLVALTGSVKNKEHTVNHQILVYADQRMSIGRQVIDQNGTPTCETTLSGGMVLVNHERLQWNITSSDGKCGFGDSHTTETRYFNRVEEE